MAETMLKSKVIFFGVPTVNSESARSFYNTLFGSDDFALAPNPNVESYFRPISSDGINLVISERHSDSESITPYFAVENLDEAIKGLQESGGKLIDDQRIEIMSSAAKEDGSVGRMVKMFDPDMNPVGLVELNNSVEAAFRWGRFQRPLAPDQVEGLEALKEYGGLQQQGGKQEQKGKRDKAN